MKKTNKTGLILALSAAALFAGGCASDGSTSDSSSSHMTKHSCGKDSCSGKKAGHDSCRKGGQCKGANKCKPDPKPATGGGCN